MQLFLVAWTSLQHSGLGSKKLYHIFKPSLRSHVHPFCHTLLARSETKGHPTLKRSLGSTFLWEERQRNCGFVLKPPLLGALIKPSHWSLFLKPHFLAQGVCIPLLLSLGQPLGFLEERAEDSTNGPDSELTVVLQSRATKQEGSCLRGVSFSLSCPTTIPATPQSSRF